MSGSDQAHWDGRWAEAEPPGDPDPWLPELDEMLPRSGRAVDLAGGQGRNSLWLAARGLDVTIVDVSPVGLVRASAAAAERGLELATEARDLPADGPPPGPWDVALIVRYLDRDLVRAVPSVLSPGGLLAFTQPTVTNLERHDHPRAEFLLGMGEMAALADELDDVEVVQLTEDWTPQGTHEARLVIRKR
ncbi:MAG: methyltransferase domain-containing protein [Actinomycetota bacterium]